MISPFWRGPPKELVRGCFEVNLCNRWTEWILNSSQPIFKKWFVKTCDGNIELLSGKFTTRSRRLCWLTRAIFLTKSAFVPCITCIPYCIAFCFLSALCQWRASHPAQLITTAPEVTSTTLMLMCGLVAEGSPRACTPFQESTWRSFSSFWQSTLGFAISTTRPWSRFCFTRVLLVHCFWTPYGTLNTWGWHPQVRETGELSIFELNTRIGQLCWICRILQTETFCAETPNSF